MDGNAIYHIERNFLQGFTRLTRLSLRFCMARIIDSHAFNHSTIRRLDVSENLWFFDKVHGPGIHPGLFLDMPDLKSINMSWTVFRFSDDDEREQVLSSVSHVEAFTLEGTGLSFIPSTILSEFRNLTYLNFGKNEITFLPDDTFENLTSLRVLDLSKNHLTTISKNLLQDVVSRDNVTLDLSGNPFSCTCDLLWFIELYKKDDSKETEKQRNRKQKQTCRYETYVAILFISIFVMVSLVVVSLIYRFRWRLRFLLYTLQHRLSRDRPSGPAPPPKYDVFVSYDSKDNDWVLRELRSELEDRRGLRLCLHERDFTPGRYISDNIIEKMQESGTILPVLSNAFLKSEWCRFELFVAVKSGLAHAQRRVPLVPLLLENLDRSAVDSFVSALLNTTTYLAWPQAGDLTSPNTRCNMSSLYTGEEGTSLDCRGAINGNIGTTWIPKENPDANCLYTARYDRSPSWQVDLGQPRNIHRIIIYSDVQISHEEPRPVVDTEGNKPETSDPESNYSHLENYETPEDIRPYSVLQQGGSHPTNVNTQGDNEAVVCHDTTDDKAYENVEKQ
nr:hypothetical protein BaRGS_012637 [Batillaria attramentaria]